MPVRLFIAISLDEHILDAVGAMQEELRRNRVRGNFTKTENLHLTLAFIGEYGDPDRVLDALRPLRFEPMQLRLEGFGSFGDLYWCGLAKNEELAGCVRRLRRALSESGIPFDRKRFAPHITLLRRAVCAGMPGVTVPQASMTAERISLFRSDRGKSGMIYTELGSVYAEAHETPGDTLFREPV